MKKIAIDIVCFLPPDMLVESIRLNQVLLQHSPALIALDPVVCIPHISLLMGTICAKNLPLLQDRLATMVKPQAPVRLKATTLYSNSVPGLGKIQSIAIEPSAALAQIHQLLVKDIRPLMQESADQQAFYNPLNVTPLSVQWVNSFQSDAILEHYKPHITLGFGQTKLTFKPVTFEVSQLGICQLGNLSTCRKVLSVYTLPVV